MGEVFDFGLKGVDLNKIVGNAMQLPQAISLAQQGKVDEAADIYSQITGMEHADALASVKAMAAGHAVSLTPGRPNVNWQQFETSYSQPSIQVRTPSVSTSTPATKSSGGVRSCALLFGIIAAVAILIVALVGGGLFAFANNDSNAVILPASAANQTLSFGTEGIGPGMLKDARSLSLDSKGNIIVADYEDGRIQTFDPNGKFLSSFSLSGDGQKVYIGGMAVGRDGNVYIAHNGKISIHDSEGNPVGEISDDSHRYEDVVLGGDGKLYALADSETIVRFTSDRDIDLEIPNTFSSVTNDSELDAHLAVDGLGNMYVVGTFNYLVLKYSPQGKYINQFGGKADSSSSSDQPGKFTSPHSIAVDGYGRVYVGDFFDIKVFDSSGAYLNIISLKSGVPFHMLVDNENNLYAVTSQNHVLKYALNKPSGE
jgi:sugar lactone lactonase YvrE